MLTVEEVSEILRISVQTVRRLIDDGQLRAYRVRGQWRVKKEDLDDYLRRIVS